MSTATLHYIYDPLCGWCYGAAPLVKVARELLPVQAHAGGMMTGAHRQQVSEQLRSYVMGHDQRIAQLTSQVFGDAYFNGLLRDTTAVFDSEPPVSAILAAEKITGNGLDMLARLQTAHYVEGRRIADSEVLSAIAVELGMDRQAFNTAFNEVRQGATQQHFAATRALMQKLGARGFPSFALELDGELHLIDISRYMGQAAAFAEWLKQRLPVEASDTAPTAFQCGPDSCAI